MFDWQDGAQKYIDALSSSAPTPGGGSAAAVCGAIGAGLALMAVRTTLKMKKTPEENKPALNSSERDLEKLQKDFNRLSIADAEAYQNYIDVKKQDKPASEIDDAMLAAAKVPVECTHACLKALEALSSVQGKISKIILSDAHCGAHVLRAALKCCVENMLINRNWIKEPEMLETLEGTILMAASALGENK